MPNRELCSNLSVNILLSDLKTIKMTPHIANKVFIDHSIDLQCD